MDYFRKLTVVKLRTVDQTGYVGPSIVYLSIMLTELLQHAVKTYLHNPLKTEFLLKICKNSVRTSQETHYVSATKPNRLMLFRETVAVYSENHTEHTNILCGQNTEI
jgi:hypothetical protein